MQKTAYVLVEPDYESMPEAIKYSIFAGAKMGDTVIDNDGMEVVIDENNPAMDIQGSTGAGSGETAFTTVVAVAENTINGINDFVQNLGDWMNRTFGTSFETDHNSLVNINVSEAVMNNDAHSNGNIMIGVQALNTSRTKDTDYDGDAAPIVTNTNQTEIDKYYTGHTDAEDYGQVNFTAQDKIKFGYSRYAQARVNTSGIAGWALNLLDTNPQLTRVYVQNQQFVYIVQHTINILDQMDLDDCTTSSFPAKFNDAATAYFAVNSKVSNIIKQSVIDQKDNLTFTSVDDDTKTITFNNQQAIVYRVNQKNADLYLHPGNSDDSTSSETRLEQLTGQLSSLGYDKVFKNNNPSEGYLYQSYGDEGTSSIGHNDVIIQRFEKYGKLVDKTEDGAVCEYTCTLKFNGNKVDRNTDKVLDQFRGRFNENDIKRTNLGAEFAITRTFKENSEYITTPNLTPYFTRTINQSVRDAVKKRGQFNGVTQQKRAYNEIVYAVDNAKNDLQEVQQEIDYKDNTYSDTSKYTSDYAKNILFKDFKSSSTSGLTKLTSTAQTLGGASMSTHSYKGFELYNDQGQLKSASDFVREYQNKVETEKLYGSYAVNKYAEDRIQSEREAVENKKTDIYNQYGNNNDMYNESYGAKKNEVNIEIRDMPKPNIEDVEGVEGEIVERSQILPTPTKPITSNEFGNLFLGDGSIYLLDGSSVSVDTNSNSSKRKIFNYDLTSHQITNSQKPSAVTAANVALPDISSGYTAATIPSVATSEYTIGGNNAFAFTSTNYDSTYFPSVSLLGTSGLSNGGNIEGTTGTTGNPMYLENNKYYSNINWPKKKGSGWFASTDPVSVIVGDGSTTWKNSVTGQVKMDEGGKSIDIENKATLSVSGNVLLEKNGAPNVNVKGRDSVLNVGGNFQILSTNATDFTLYGKAHIGGYMEVDENIYIPAGYNAKLTVNGNNKRDVTVDGLTYKTAVDSHGHIYVDGEMYVKGDVVGSTGDRDVIVGDGTNAATMVVNGNLKVRRNLTVRNNGKLIVYNAFTDNDRKPKAITIEENYNASIQSYQTITVNGELYAKGDVATTRDSSNNVDIGSNAVVVIDGNLKSRGSITVGAGATLIVKNNIVAWSDITNNGRIICGGDVISKDGKITNYENRVIKADGSITAKKTITNNPGGTISAKLDLSCTTLTNDAAGSSGNASSGNTEIIVGRNLTASTSSGTAIYNSASSVANNDAILRVNGAISCGANLNNNRSGNASGSWAFIYAGGNTSCGTLNNYERSFFHSSGALNTVMINNENNCQIKTSSSIKADGEISNGINSWISAGTTLTGYTVNNQGVMYSGTDFTATSGLSSSGAGVAITVGGKLTVGGNAIVTKLWVGGSIVGTSSGRADISCDEMIVKGGIQAKSINVIGTVRVNNAVSITNKLTVGANATFNAISDLEAGYIENNNSLYVVGDLSTTVATGDNNYLTNNKDLFCWGEISANGVLHNSADSTIRCIGDISVGKYVENFGELYLGTTASPSDINVNEYYTAGYLNRSIDNRGKLYITGDIATEASVFSNGGEIYVLGNIRASNNTANNSSLDHNMLELESTNYVYVRGCVTSDESSSNKRIWMHCEDGQDHTSSVLSILGNGHDSGKDCFNNKLEAFSNGQSGSYVYLGTNLKINGAGTTNDSWFLNSGRLYVYGDINCPNLLSAWLVGSYNYNKTLAEEYVSGTYDSSTPHYSGLTYCFGSFNAPYAKLTVGDKHYVYIEDDYIEHYNDAEYTGGPHVNLNVMNVDMWSDGWLYAPNEAIVTDRVQVAGTAIFNVRNKLSTQGTGSEGSGRIEAPIQVNLESDSLDLSGLPRVVRGSEDDNPIKNWSYNGITIGGTEFKVYGNLTVNGDLIVRNGSRLVVTGNLKCNSLTIERSKVHVGGTLDISNSSNVKGNLTMTNLSALLVDSDLIRANVIDLDHSDCFITGTLQNTASNIILNTISTFTLRNSDTGVTGNHNNNLPLNGSTIVNGGSSLFIDGQLSTTGITVNSASKVYAYSGVTTLTRAVIDIDRTSRGETNSIVYFGENTPADYYLDVQCNGSVYLPSGYTYTSTFNLGDYGYAICGSNIRSNWVQVGTSSTAQGKALLYCGGRVYLTDNAYYTIYNKLYAYDGTDMTNGYRASGNNDYDFKGLQDGSDTYIGKIYLNGTECTGSNNFTTNGYYTNRGTVYIESNLKVNGYNSNNKVGNRYTGLYMPSGGKAYISGSVEFSSGNATLIEQNATFITKYHFKIHSTIWNYGTLHIFGWVTTDFDHNYATDNKSSDSKPYEGWSLKNGNDWDDGGGGASFLVYNQGNVGDMIYFKGYVKNSGEIYMNNPVSINGYCTQSGMAKDFAFVNFAGSKAHFAGEFRCNGNRFMNRWNSTFGCDGRLSYGEVAFNCSKMYVGGDLLNGYDSSFSTRDPGDYRDNAVGFLNMGGSDSRSFSFMNGAYKVNGDTTSNPDAHTWKDAVLYVGGNLQIGNYESEKKAGSVLNVGTMYVGHNFKVYSYGGNEGLDTGPAFYQTAIYAPNDSNTFIGGECYSGAAAATGKNSIFMVDGDFRIRRPLKVNMWFKFYDAKGSAGNVLSYFEDHQYKNKGWLGDGDDGYRACYMRVGGNLYCNVEGRDLENSWFTTTGELVPYDHSRDIDIQANSNIVIGGSFYCPQKLYIKQNANLIVCGQGESIYDNNGNLNWKCRALDELSDQKNNPAAFGPDIAAVIKGNISNLASRLTGERCSLFAYMMLDMDICSQLLVHGNAYVRDTCKIRDMTKTYVYGNFIAQNYLELGKSLDNDNSDATQARLDKYKAEGENDDDYVFSNAGYMYVQGNLSSRKYTKVYASTTLKVGGDMSAGDLTQLLGNPYITLRHDARVFVGGNMNAYSSIDCGAYSEMYVNGNVTARTQNIKLRDQMTCYIGGNLTAATYLELGKYDDNFYRGVKNSRVQAYLNAANDNKERDEEQGTTTEGGENSYNGDEHEQNGDSSNAGNDNQTESETTEENNAQFISDTNELENDDSDLAVGSEYYIGGNIISFTNYIQEYAYSRVVSGGYVLTPQHLTLRHNSDLWVLPEVFEYYVCSTCGYKNVKSWEGACPDCGHTDTLLAYACSKCDYKSASTFDTCPSCGREKTCARISNETYYHTDFEYQDGWDSSLWSAFKTRVQAAMYAIEDGVKPKTGSVYSIGQMTMNKNTSIFSTYNTVTYGQMVMRRGSLVYTGHNYECHAPTYNINPDYSSWDSLFNSLKGALGLSDTKTYHGFDSYDSEDPNAANPKPIVVYANNEINIATTAKIRSTYFVTNRGALNFTNLDSISKTSPDDQEDAKSLPNAFASYQNSVNYYALRGSLGALMYAPKGNVNLDGFAYDFYGSIIGDTVDINTYYINVHRFHNWRNLDMHIATSKNVYLISEETYKNAKNNVNDIYIYGYDTNPNTALNEWAQVFFPGLGSDEDED